MIKCVTATQNIHLLTTKMIECVTATQKKTKQVLDGFVKNTFMVYIHVMYFNNQNFQTISRS